MNVRDPGRNMRKPYTDWDFLVYLVPENKLGKKRKKKKMERIKEYQNNRKKREQGEFAQ